MVLYRRNRIPGATYFFTVTLSDRQSDLLTRHIDCLREAFRFIRRRRPFVIDAMVVLPDHLHALWTLPPGDSDYPGRWRALKSRFTRGLAGKGISIERNDKGEYRLWQRRYWEHTIRDERDLRVHVDYIHYNPVKHGWVKRPMDWPHSSLHRFVRAGWVSADWAAGGVEIAEATNYGER